MMRRPVDILTDLILKVAKSAGNSASYFGMNQPKEPLALRELLGNGRE